MPRVNKRRLQRSKRRAGREWMQLLPHREGTQHRLFDRMEMRRRIGVVHEKKTRRIA